VLLYKLCHDATRLPVNLLMSASSKFESFSTSGSVIKQFKQDPLSIHWMSIHIYVAIRPAHLDMVTKLLTSLQTMMKLQFHDKINTSNSKQILSWNLHWTPSMSSELQPSDDEQNVLHFQQLAPTTNTAKDISSIVFLLACTMTNSGDVNTLFIVNQWSIQKPSYMFKNSNKNENWIRL